jgi:heme-degrading monooxygenase HmoA
MREEHLMEVCRLDWHISPFRADRFLDTWEAAAAKATAYGCKSWSLTRAQDDPQAFQQTMAWDSHGDFERYWYSDEIAAAREKIIGLYVIPLLPTWHTVVTSGEIAAAQV